MSAMEWIILVAVIGSMLGREQQRLAASAQALRQTGECRDTEHGKPPG